MGGCYWYIKVLIELLQWAVDALFLAEIQDREYSRALGCFELLLLMRAFGCDNRWRRVKARVLSFSFSRHNKTL